jgi:cytochrome c oxidase assembly protein subunit 15
MGHLLGGMLIFSVLVILRARMMESYPKFQHNWRIWLSIGDMISFIQIALGGWVSSNYAAISCQGFPGCNGLWVPPLNWTQAFDFLQSIGPNYQGGLMDVDARMTIHWLHRCFAVMVYLFWMVLAALILRKESNRVIHQALWSLLFFLHVQMALGIFNVTHDMPLLTAVLHNGVAALILGMACLLNVMIRGSSVSHD